MPPVTKRETKNLTINIAGETLELMPQRAINLVNRKVLLLADLHLGKINHFRKAGMPLPPKANERNMEQLVELIDQAKPERVIFLGDLFHSHYNEEWEVFGQLIRHFVGVTFELVLGNHDIMSEYQYTKHGLLLHEELEVGPFLLTHHPIEKHAGERYNLAGHLHPGARLVGRGRQSLMLPCFHFGKHQGLLPSFGEFTGLARIVPKPADHVFVIVNDKIVKV